MDDIIKISFPGLGIEEFTINRVAFSLFGLEVRWYGVIITFGILCAYFYAAYRARGEKIKTDDMIDIAMVTVISGIVGARLYYVLTTLDVISYESLWDMINIRRGGLAIYGGIIGGVIGIAVMAHIKRISLPRLLDCITPGVMIAQAIGRWGNFFNGEAFGEQTEIFCRMGLQKFDWAKMYYYHPTFLYESLWNLIGFILINLVYRKKKFDGQNCLLYFTWYGLGRMFIEGLRTDSLYVGTFRISQVVAFLSFVAGIVLLCIGLYRAKLQRLENGDYAVVYGRLSKPAEETAAGTESAAEAELDTTSPDTKMEENEDGKVD